ncbi:MAG: UDP-2,3-diacylglucosamine diphosphatase [Duncaniella sp.]|nr:UDP-2,3-diacylglucosamine diphosphatase [Duncaniella sp.]
MSATKTYFISDLHLGAAYIADARAQEMAVCRWLVDVVLPDAARLYLLGDILDFWWEYKNVVPRGFTRFLGTLARLSDAGIEITWLKGNHDIWIYDYLPTEIGLRVHDGLLTETIDGRKFVMEHGDGVGRRPASFLFLRRLFRCRPLQKAFAAIHPRLTIGFAHAWSARSRKKGGYTPPAMAGESLVQWAEEYNAANYGSPADFFIFGHQHILLDRRISPSGRVIILGDWISHFSYGVFDGENFYLRQFGC